MKKWLSYFLFVVYLFSYSEAHQFLKIPNLITHYYAHAQKDHSTTLFSFLKMHYLEDHGKDLDHNEDMKLPFKSHDTHCHALSSGITIPPETYTIELHNKNFVPEKEKLFFYKEPFSTSLITSILRPPILG